MKMKMEMEMGSQNGGVRLPIGFRFRPTDEELLIHYLKRKVLSLPLPATVIPELEAFQFNPWDLPGDLKEKRYFFCQRKRNLMNKCCSSSLGTDCGYWKSSGKEKQIMDAASNHLIGIRKSFVFYQDRKLKTQWVIQEFSLVGSLKTPFLQQIADASRRMGCLPFVSKKKRARNNAKAAAANGKKSLDFKNELGLSMAQTASFLPSSPSSCSSGVTEITSSDLDQEASN